MQIISGKNNNVILNKTLMYFKQKSLTDEKILSTPTIIEHSFPKKRVIYDYHHRINPFLHLLKSLWLLQKEKTPGWIMDLYPQREMCDKYERERLHLESNFRLDFSLEIDSLKKDTINNCTTFFLFLPYAKIDSARKHYITFYKTNGMLHMTVATKVKDGILSFFDSNGVFLSFLLEYMASMAGLKCGNIVEIIQTCYTSYEPEYFIDTFCDFNYYKEDIVPFPLISHTKSFDEELNIWFHPPKKEVVWKNSFFPQVATPIFKSWKAFSRGESKKAIKMVSKCRAQDWRKACISYIENPENTLIKKENMWEKIESLIATNS